MSIRLRKVGDVHVALCAVEADEKEGDIYIDDNWHYALAAKFMRDWYGETNTIIYTEEWKAMDTQKLRDCRDQDWEYPSAARLRFFKFLAFPVYGWLWVVARLCGGTFDCDFCEGFE